jgi:recombination protein RecT
MGRVKDQAEVERAGPQPPSPKQVITHLLERNKSAIGLSLPKGMDQDRFVRLLLTATVTNPDLLECDPNSFLRAGVLSAQLGLEPNDPREEAYLIKYKDSRNRYGAVVNFQIGYRGLMKLARQAGVTTFHVFPVYTGDAFKVSLGDDPHIFHEPAYDSAHYGNPEQLTHAYAVARFEGESQFYVANRKEIEQAKAKSQTGRKDTGPWKDDYEAMALKTAIRRLCKFLPQSPQMAQALAADEHGLVMADLPALPVASEHDGMDDEDVIDGELMVETDYVKTLPPDNVDPETGERTLVEPDPNDPERPF